MLPVWPAAHGWGLSRRHQVLQKRDLSTVQTSVADLVCFRSAPGSGSGFGFWCKGKFVQTSKQASTCNFVQPRLVKYRYWKGKEWCFKRVLLEPCYFLVFLPFFGPALDPEPPSNSGSGSTQKGSGPSFATGVQTRLYSTVTAQSQRLSYRFSAIEYEIMYRGKLETTRNISCSNSFFSTFHVISRKFWFLF